MRKRSSQYGTFLVNLLLWYIKIEYLKQSGDHCILTRVIMYELQTINNNISML